MASIIGWSIALTGGRFKATTAILSLTLYATRSEDDMVNSRPRFMPVEDAQSPRRRHEARFHARLGVRVPAACARQPIARAITPKPRTIHQGNPNSQQIAPIAPVALTGSERG